MLFRKLILAVLVLSLFFVGSTAIAGNNVSELEQDRLNRADKGLVSQTPKHAKQWPNYDDVDAAQNRALENAIDLGPITPPAKPGAFGGDTLSNPCPRDYDWTIYGVYTTLYTRPGGDPRELATKYDIQASHVADVDGVWLWVYTATDTSTAGGCDPVDVAITLYGDMGGLPNDGDIIFEDTMFVSALAPFNEDLSGGGFWLFQDFDPNVLVEGTENFHVGHKVIGCAEEAVKFVMTDGSGATGRGSYRIGGIDWGSMIAAVGADRLIGSSCVYCEYYSSCEYYTGIPSGGVYLWDMPLDAAQDLASWGGEVFADGSTLDGWGQRYTSEGPDTINTVRVLYFDDPWGIQPYLSSNATNGFTVSIYGDLAGAPDLGAGALASVAVPGGPGLIINPGWWNWQYVDFTSFNLVMTGSWHVLVQMDGLSSADGVLYAPTAAGDGLATGGSIHFSPTIAPNAEWDLLAASPNWLNDIGLGDNGWDIRVLVCHDEFYECQTQVLYDDFTAIDWYYRIDDQWNAWAQKVVGNPVNRLDAFRILIDWYDVPPPFSADRNVYFTVWADGGSGPGAIIYQELIVNPVLVPLWQEVVIPGGLQVVGDFFIGVEYDPVSLDLAERLCITTEDGSSHLEHEVVNGGFWGYRDLSGFGIGTTLEWHDADVVLGWPDNMFAEADFCSIPVAERTCFPQDDHVTFGFDMARSGASGLSMGDAWCDLNLTYHYEVTGKASIWSSPIIADGYAVASFTDNYQIFDLANSANVAVLDIAHFGGDLFVVGNGIRCTPTVATIDSAGTPLRTLFISGGTSRTVSAIDFAPPFNKRWTSPVASGNFGAVLPTTPYGGLLVVNVAGEDVLIWHTQAGRVYASRADDGTLFAGWATNPVNLGGQINTAGASDGTNIYYSTTDPDGGTPGDVYKIDAATGTILLQLSVDADLQGDDVYGAAAVDPLTTDEGFGGGMAYDAANDILWTNSTMSGDFPVAGVFYSINCSDFSINNAVQSHQEVFAAPIIDQSRVYHPQGSNWINPPLGRNMFAFRRPQGDLSYVTGGPSTEVPALYYTQAALSCEPGVPDLLFAFDGSRAGYVSAGFLSCFNADTGEELFRRRIENGTQGLNQGCGVAIGNDLNGDIHLVTMDVAGNFYDFTKGVDRPRFEIQNYVPEAPVEFGFLPSVVVTLEDILYNSGCATLNIFAANIDTVDTGTDMPEFAATNDEVRPDVLENAITIAERLADNKFIGNIESVDPTAAADEVIRLAENSDKGYTNSSSAIFGLPWLNGYTVPLTIAAGTYEDILVDVNQSVLDRGPHTFYLTFETDDPDFFLNDNTILPQMLINIVGGCLIDTTTLEFGAGGANYRWVTNTARLGTGDWTPHGWEIDGDGSSYYQGSYIYGVNKYRLAMNSQDWTSGGGEAEGFFSAQGDPNWCDNSCKPFLVTSCQMGEISYDGVTYSPVTGNMVCATWVDSVQSYYDAADGADDNWTWHGGWDTDGAFDDTLSIGLTVDQKSFGAVDVDGFTNFTLDLFTFTERNGDTVEGWYFGSFHDYDAAGPDSIDYDAAVSSAWQGGNTEAWGQSKLPFGCGIDPMIGAVGMHGNEGLWNSDPYYDSAYMWMSTYTGGVNHPPTGDFQAHHTFVGHDFLPNESFTTATISFGLTGLADGHDPADAGLAAYAANKWIGFGRGDIDNDNKVTIADVVYLNAYVADPGTNPGPIPFMHLGDVDADGDVDIDDVLYLKAYYFECGPCPLGEWAAWLSCAP